MGYGGRETDAESQTAQNMIRGKEASVNTEVLS